MLLVTNGSPGHSFFHVDYCHRQDMGILSVNNYCVPVPKVQWCCGVRRPCCFTSISSPRDHFCAGTSPTPTNVYQIAEGPLQALLKLLPPTQISYCLDLPPHHPNDSQRGLQELLLLWSSNHLAKTVRTNTLHSFVDAVFVWGRPHSFSTASVPLHHACAIVSRCKYARTAMGTAAHTSMCCADGV